MSTASKDKTVEPLVSRLKAQLSMLTVQFLVGMAVNLIGLPSETSGSTKVIDSLLVGVHVLVGVGLLINAGLIVRYTARLNELMLRTAWYGVLAIVLTFLFGVLTMALKSNWWSYAMALGFIASYILYGEMYFRMAGWRVKQD